MCPIIPEKRINVIYGSYQYIYNAIYSEQLPLWDNLSPHITFLVGVDSVSVDLV